VGYEAVFTYTASDGSLSDTATVTVTVTADNDAPVAQDDSGVGFGTDKDTSFTTADVLDNDSDPDVGDSPIFDSYDAILSGTLSYNGDGTFDYDPNGQFDHLGASDEEYEVFTYVISDTSGLTDTATVTITVTGMNTSPVANDDSGTGFETDEDSSFTTGDVLANDTDAETPGSLTVDSYDDGNLSGTLSDNGNGTFGYDPNGQFEDLAAGEWAEDVFTYVVTDGVLTDTATVTITVSGLNDAPTADDDTFSVDEDSSDNALDVLDGDTDPDVSDTLTVHAVGATDQGGTVTDNDTDVLYTPAADFVGDEVFTYTVSDGNGSYDTATVTVTVNPATLDYVVIEDAAGGTGSEVTTHAMVAGDTFQVWAAGYDADNNYLGDVAVDWSGTGVTTGQLSPTANVSSTTFTAQTAGAGAILADAGSGITDTTGVITVNPDVLHHFAFDTISNQTAGQPFSITITAQDEVSNTVTNYHDTVTLTDTTGTISPTTTGNFTDGIWTGSVTITEAQKGITITAQGGGVSGFSNSFDVVEFKVYLPLVMGGD